MMATGRLVLLRRLRLVAGSCAAVIALAAATSAPASERSISIRVGWQSPWATQGQIVQSLKHTNALALNGMDARFEGFSFGGPLNAAALAGQVDVIFTADQPAAALLATGAHWKIVARLMYNRVSIYVPPRSSIKSIRDLRGKTIGMPFGAAAQREALRAVAAAGLDPDRDIRSINLDMYQQVPIVLSGSADSWRGVDALAGFDPVPAAFQARRVARMVHTANVVAVVMMSDDFVARNPDGAERFLRSYQQAYFYYVRHQAQAGGWFVAEAGLPFGANVLRLCASVEPNIRAKKPMGIRTRLTDAEVARMQAGITFLYQHQLIKTPVRMKTFVDQRYGSRARAYLAKHPSLFTRTHAVP